MVRGAVTDRATGAAVAGALVTLERESPASAADTAGLRNVLTSETGDFTVSAPGAGRFRLLIKRIGSRRYTSDAFPLAPGETRHMDVALDRVATSLPGVAVTGKSLCGTRLADASRLAELWDDARAALTAAQITARDRLARYELVRYSRALDPTNLAVLDETHRAYGAAGDSMPPVFTSLRGDSLSTIGYWQPVNEMTTIFYGLDANALLSDAFVRDHCFTVSDGTGDRRGLVGLSFEPVRGRTVPEIRGTVWLDARTSELRWVEFSWLRLPDNASGERTGGRVYFTRLAGGPWIVRRWYLRIPRSLFIAPAPNGGVRPIQVGLEEEGGFVFSPELARSEEPAELTGIVRDSTGRPLAGARVTLLGTSWRTMIDSSGRFRFDSLPPGVYALAADHADYARYGVRIGRTDIVLEEGARRELDFRAPGAAGIAFAMCDGRMPGTSEATLRLTLIRDDSRTPLPGVTLRLTWSGTAQVSRGRRSALGAREHADQAITDSAGVATFCNVPAGTPLSVGLPAEGDHIRILTTLRMSPREIALRVLEVAGSPP